MQEVLIRFPVRCPICGDEQLIQVPVAAVADALVGGRAIPLRSICHDQAWDASPGEKEQIREYLAANLFIN